MKRTTLFTIALVVWISASIQAPAQWPVPPPGPVMGLRSPSELDQLLAPIALYPDPLIAQILPAATVPSEIVMAARYVFGGGDPGQLDYQPWSPGVRAVAHYPDVLRMMDQRLDWTTQLGQAFLYQQEDVMAAIQRLRFQARMLGNLRTTPELCVAADNGMIEILPANPDLLYVPVYQPDLIFMRRGFFLSFGAGFSIGFWMNSDCDWHRHNVVVWSRDHYRPHDWWGRPSRERFRSETVYTHVNVWRPQARASYPAASRADRGWETREVHPVRTPAFQPVVRAVEVRPATRPVVEPRVESRPVAPRAVSAPVAYPSVNVVVGGETARETRAASSRGQQSRAVIAPPSRPPAPVSTSPSRGTSPYGHAR